MFRINAVRLLLVFATAIFLPELAWGQHHDLHFGRDATASRLLVEAEVFSDTFGDFGVEFFTDDPGFRVSDFVSGPLHPLAVGDNVSFNILTALLYSDGIELVDQPPNDPVLEIDAGFSRLVTTTSEPQEGFVFGTADSDGGIHEHVDFVLTPGSNAGEGAAPVGAYGVWLELTSSGYMESDPLLLLFNNGLTPQEFGDVLADIDPWRAALGTPGDGNDDGKVDGLDYLIWAENFGDNPADDPPGSPANGDFDGNGQVDGLDYIVWASHFGMGPEDAIAVPEPATWVSAVASFALAVSTIGPRRRAKPTRKRYYALN